MKYRLFTPGPTPIPEAVALSLAQPILHHRQPEFKEILRSVSGRLKYVFQTAQDVLILTSSGTGAMEAAVANLLSSGDAALYINGGRFGQRWGEILKKYGVSAVEVRVEWGAAVTPDQIEEEMRKFPQTRAVFLTHSETSTATAIDLKPICEVIRRSSDALVVVDGISSVGALELRTDDWGIDCVITASQKGLMLPPGLAFLALSDRAWDAVQKSTLPKFYFDLLKARKALADWQTPWTPAISLIVGLSVALEMIQQEGIEKVWARHSQMAQALREAGTALGLQIYSRSPSNAVTALCMPEGVDAEELRKILKQRHGIIVAGGQDSLKGKIIRVAHLGHFDELDIIAVISALGLSMEEALVARATQTGESRKPFDPTMGLKAVLKEFTKIT